MDELERDLRSTFETLAGDAEPSEALVVRTERRAGQLRRRRRVLASGAVVAVLALAGVAVAVAGDSDGLVVEPPASEPTSTTSEPSSTTTTTGPPPTTAAPGGAPIEEPPGPAPTPPPSTVPFGVQPNCGPTPIGTWRYDREFTTLEDGSVRVTFGGHPFGPAREYHVYVFDNGSQGAGVGVTTYGPDDLGPHWVEVHSEHHSGTVWCPIRYEFDVVATPPTTDTTSPTTTAPPTSQP